MKHYTSLWYDYIEVIEVMPIYEYLCNKCGSEFELLVASSSAKPDEGCPDCGSKKIEKQMSLFGFSSGSKSADSSGGHNCSSCSSSNCSSCHWVIRFQYIPQANKLHIGKSHLLMVWKTKSHQAPIVYKPFIINTLSKYYQLA